MVWISVHCYGGQTRASRLTGEVRSDQVVQATLALIRRHRMRVFTVAAIAAKVGVVPSVVYRHFGARARTSMT